MAQEAGSRPARIPEEPTVASVLGVKGQLRFHPHGSTQKAHVVLRQVELAEESDDEGDSSIVYFSLFAHKRIEVRPGKEMLLAVATPDGKFLDSPVVFAGRVSGEDDLTPSASLQPSRIEPPPGAQLSILPPKLRKPWQETQIAGPAITDKGQPTYASIEVQTDPVRISDVPVQTLPTAAALAPTAIEVQAKQSEVISAVATSALKAQTARRPANPTQRARSLSPMELDSRSSTPKLSTSQISEQDVQSNARVKSTSFSPPGLSITMPSEGELSQLDTASAAKSAPLPTPPNMSPDSDSPPGLSLPPLSAQPAAWTSGTVTASSSVATVATSKERVDELLSAASTLIPSQPARVNKSDSSVEGELRGTEVIQRPATPATPYVPKRKTVPNPFVRGGVLTDFVGSAPPGKAVPQDMSTAQSSGASVSPKKEPIPISIGTVPPVPVQPVPPSPKQVTERSATSPTPSIPAPSSSHSPPRKWRELSPPSSPASSSKVKVEDVPSLSSVTQPSPGVLLAQFVNRLGPVPTAPRMSRFGGPLRQQSPYPPSPDTRKAQPAGTPTEPQEFPPDYRSLAFVGEGSYSNPLNIKPAAGNKWKANGPLPPQLSTAAPLKTNGSKKPVHIGSGWPHTRANGGGGRVRRQNGMVGPQGQGILGMVGPPNGGALDRGWGTNGPGDGISNEAPRGRGPRRSRARGRYPSPEPRDMYEPTTPVPGSPISSSNPSDSPKSTKSSQDAGFLPPAAPAHNTPTPAWPSDRGVKRAASPTPETPEARRAKAFQWPTSNGLHSVKLKGDDDVGVRSITYCSDGGLFAVICNDKSVRIWSNKSRTEIAKLAHNMHITSVAWMDRDSGVVTLGENGIVSTWTRSAANKWQWAKILNAGGKGEDMPCCLAYHRDHMAIGYPRSGVKVWLFIKGTWTPQRSIVRQNVTAIRFIGEGEALIGGTADGVLWHCQVPNGTLRASAFLRSKLFALDVDPRGTHALAAQAGSCILVNITHEGQGQVEQAYSPEESEVQAGAAYDFGALFAARGASLLFGSTQGCVLVWDRASGAIIHGLCHGEDHSIQAVASFDGSQVSDGHILTGTRQGQLTWFSQPPVDGSENRKGSW